MIPLGLGALTLLLLMGALGLFERARVATLRQFALWFAAIGGLALIALLALTGRVVLAIGVLILLGPMLIGWNRRKTALAPLLSLVHRPTMTRQDAYRVLGLTPGARMPEVLAAHRELRRRVDPEAEGGSAWLAARVDEARDVLLG